ncbi:MAG: hypothetical protein EBE86_031905 [Hormoscilla sp. GUM202]|nr:hypothetical protein [Hormoscilla sp. GUM202]
MKIDTTAYRALKVFYTSTSGKDWKNKTGWENWDFSSETPPDANVV